MEFKDSQTYKNLEAAFAGESKARNKYTYYASKAKKEGYVQISKIFEETAHNEMAHAKIWFKLLNDGIGTTKENLKEAASGEHYEWTSMYEDYAKTARDEGYNDIAALFQGVAAIERHHDERFEKLLENIENDEVFTKELDQYWICLNCGHITRSKNAPVECPVCHHPQGYFELLEKNY